MGLLSLTLDKAPPWVLAAVVAVVTVEVVQKMIQEWPEYVGHEECRVACGEDGVSRWTPQECECRPRGECPSPPPEEDPPEEERVIYAGRIGLVERGGTTVIYLDGQNALEVRR